MVFMMHNRGGLSTVFSELLNKFTGNIRNLWVAISRQDAEIADLKLEIFQLKMRLNDLEKKARHPEVIL